MSAEVRSQIPLSYPQHLLRFFEVLHPGSAFGPTFIITTAYRLRGSVDLDALHQAVADLLARHDALRSVVVPGEGVPWQEIASPGAGRVDVVDVTTGIDDLLDELDTREYPADAAPLLWVVVGRVVPDDAVLALVAHHSVADAWSMDVLVRDLAALYAARLDGHAGSLPSPARYADYAVADQASPATTSAVEYWQRQLADVPVVSLPVDSSRPTLQGTSKARLRFDIDDQLAPALGAVSRAARCTPFMTHLTGYLVLLHKLTGAVDVAVPTLTSGRGRPAVGDTVGFFLNALLLRTSLDGDPSVAEVLDRVRSTCLAAYRHEVPILQMIEDVPDAGLLLADESFVLLPFQHIPVPERVARPFGPSCTYQPFQRRPGTRARGVAVPLDGLWTVHRDSGGALNGNVSYSTELFSGSSMQSFVGSYLGILRQVAAYPGLRLSEVRVASA